MTVTPELPYSCFTTACFDARQRFDAWRDSISVIFDVATPDQEPPQHGFHASIRAYLLDGLFVAQADFDGQRFERSRRKITLDGLDHYQLQLYANGGLTGSAGERERILRAGDVQLLDLARPNVTHAKASETVAIIVPRDRLDAALPRCGDLHGLVLRGDRGSGGLLADYMKSLIVRLASMSAEEAAPMARASIDVIAACLLPTAETVARAQAQIDAVTLERLKRDIEQRLGEPGLGPDVVCAAHGISRAGLYRLFEAEGGVAKYIQERRLAHALVALSDPAQRHRRIIDIAFQWGFSDVGHFSRLFRRAFGMSPSEARHRARGGWADVAAPDSRFVATGYEHWIRRLRSA